MHERLKLQLSQSQQLLDKTSRYFWQASQFALQNYAHFNDTNKSFYLYHTPLDNIKTGYYQLQKQSGQGGQDYRLNHPLGEWCLDYCQKLKTKTVHLQFDYSQHPTKLSVLAQHQGQSGWLWLDKLGFYGETQTQEQMVFTVRTDDGKWLDEDFCRKLLSVSAHIVSDNLSLPVDLEKNAQQAIKGKTGTHANTQTELLKQESIRLDKWEEDKMNAAQEEIEHINEKINKIKREKKQASNLQQLSDLEHQEKQLKRKRTQARKNIFELEDQIAEKKR